MEPLNLIHKKTTLIGSISISHTFLSHFCSQPFVRLNKQIILHSEWTGSDESDHLWLRSVLYNVDCLKCRSHLGNYVTQMNKTKEIHSHFCLRKKRRMWTSVVTQLISFIKQVQQMRSTTLFNTIRFTKMSTKLP